MGVRKGDRIAAYLGNCSAYALLQWSAARIGAILVLINPASRGPELISALNLTTSKILFIPPSLRKAQNIPLLHSLFPHLTSSSSSPTETPNACPSLEHLVLVDNTQLGAEGFRQILEKEGLGGCGFREMLVWDEQDLPEPENVSNEDVTALQFTSGTTGLPKAVSLTHRNILNNGFLIGECMQLRPPEPKDGWKGEKLVNSPPLFHCFGAVLGNLAFWTHAGSVVYASDTFDPVLALRAAAVEQATAMTGIAAGSPVPPPTMERLVSRMNLTDLTITYGQTETSPATIMSTTMDPLALRCRTVGRVMPHTRIRIVDPLHPLYPDPTTPAVEVGKPGELWSAGYAVFKGYWGDEGETAKCVFVDEEGWRWMKTGDQAVMDEEGYVSIVGRIKDIILRGGENRFPVLIENRAMLHPGIADCSIVAVPCERMMEVVGAFVKRHDSLDGREVGREDVARHVTELLSHQSAPEWVWFMGEDGVPGEYPVTASGKIGKTACDRKMPTTNSKAVSPIPLHRSQADRDELRNQIKFLQGTIDRLSAPYARARYQSSLEDSDPPTSSFASKLESSESTSATPPSIEIEEDEFVDTRELSQLALNGILDTTEELGTEAFAPDQKTSGASFIAEARTFCDTFAAASASIPGSHSVPSPFGTVTFFQDEPTLSNILQFLPTPAESKTGIGLFIALITPFYHVLHPPAFLRRLPELQQVLAMDEGDGKNEELRRFMPVLGLYYTVLACGFSTTMDMSRFTTYPTIPNQGARIAQWMTGGMLAITAANFGEEHSIELIEAVVNICLVSVYLRGGENLAMCIAYALKLHRDPDGIPGRKFTLSEAEERRNAWWGLFMIASEINGHFGKKLSPVNLAEVNTKLPIHCLDEELAMDSKVGRKLAELRAEGAGARELTPLTLMIFRTRTAIILKKSDDLVFGPKGVLYRTVLDLHHEMMELEAMLPFQLEAKHDEGGRFINFDQGMVGSQAAYVQFLMSVSTLRLHRPFLRLDSRYRFSQEMVLRYADRVLQISLTPTNRKNWAIQNYSVISVATLLAVDLLQSPDQPNAQRIHNLIQAVIEQFCGFSDTSSLCRKGLSILRFLLKKHDSAQATVQRGAKRIKRTAGSALADALEWEDSGDMKEVLSRKLSQGTRVAPSLFDGVHLVASP
ncbi:acyl-CoA synthetase [Pseudohyphozyma bogoriensis]|nr:acyl-CoA synthetase [Pseudohyphozyma bogoriensis]